MPASSKKKKKPAANPARGFATTSVASKPKVEPSVEKSNASSPATTEVGRSTASPPAPSVPATQPSATEPKDLHELSPDELEKRLDETELQNIVDKYAAKSLRDSSRHVSRLQTECRVLRAQAQPLAVSSLLSDALIGEIVALAREDVAAGRTAADDEVKPKAVSEDDTIARLWTLQRSLLALGFDRDDAGDALNYVLRCPPLAESTGGAVWGLEECLDWLALNLDAERLPAVDARTGKPMQEKKAVGDDDVQLHDLAVQKSEDKHASERSSPSSLDRLPLDLTPEEVVEVSDLESDLEPDGLLEVYMATKSQLYELRPDLLESKKQSRTKTAVSTKKLDVSNLQSKLRKIEADVLFDQREADGLWALKKNQLAQDTAARRKLQLPEVSKTAKQTTAHKPRDDGTNGHDSIHSPTSNATTAKDTDEVSTPSSQTTEEDEDAFGGLFNALPSNASDALNDSIAGTGTAAGTNSTVIRDFGQQKGVGPKRILAETCRARDAGVSISYKQISSASFSSRSALIISWTKEQDTPEVVRTSTIDCIIRSKSSQFAMLTVATPDQDQSEAYVSVFALCQLFSESAKEEKAYLRLPPVWRDLYADFGAIRHSQIEAAHREEVRQIQKIVRSHASTEPDEDVVLTRNVKNRYNDNSGRSSPKTTEQSKDAAIEVSQRLQGLWASKSSTPAYQHMLSGRVKLPMFGFKDECLATVERSQVTIICGETGCGKSTQMPAYILESELSQGRPCKIYCTEPRRISAITLAQRVSEEMGEQKRDVGTNRSLVGYAIRLESATSASTRLVYATTGIVLRMLESKGGFDEITHIIVDEVHERSIETDFLLIILRSLIATRPNLKVILMSATVNAVKFASYFSGAPILTVPGRTFPVKTQFLEDAIELVGIPATDEIVESSDADQDGDGEGGIHSNDPSTLEASLKGYSLKTRNALMSYDHYKVNFALIVRLIERINADPEFHAFSKAILVFLPGIAEIRRLGDMLTGNPNMRDFVVHSLHSSIASEDQQLAFTIPPRGKRKIVISTNIAETGVTIPDITCVIDTGTHKEMRFDERRQISRLIEAFISRANAKQRRGRAGRVQEGLCFHLFTKHRHDLAMADQQTPEMLRLSLQDLIMRVKICKLGDIQTALADALDPPSAKNVRRAIDALIEVGALTTSEELTSLGQQLAKLPLDPYLGKLVLHGAVFSCLDIALTLAAILTSKSPFVSPIGAKNLMDLARSSFKRNDSDLLTDFNAYAAWRRVCTSGATSEMQFCKKNCLSMQTLSNIEDLKSQLLTSIVDTGLVSLAGVHRTQNSTSRVRRFVSVPAALDSHTDNADLIGAVIAWSFYPKVLARDGKGWRSVATNQAVQLHPTSILRQSPSAAARTTVKFLSFYSILQSSGGARNYNANSLSPAAPLAVLLLCGDAAFHATALVVSVDGSRLRFAVGPAAAPDGPAPLRGPACKAFVALKFLRRRLEEVVRRRWRRPDAVLAGRLGRWWALWEEIVSSWEGTDGR